MPDDVPDDIRELGARCRTARLERGMSQAAVAAVTGLNPDTVGRLERGEVPNPTKLVVLLSYFRVGPYASTHDVVESFNLDVLTKRQLLRMLQRTTEAVMARFDDHPTGGPRDLDAAELSSVCPEPPGPPVTAWVEPGSHTSGWCDGEDRERRA